MPVSDTSADPLDSGNTLLAAGRHEEALAAFDAALAHARDDIDALGGRARALRHLRRHEEALAACEQALARHPQSAELQYERAVVLHRLGRIDEALAGYERAAELNPRWASPWLRHGTAMQDAGRDAEAVASYDKALALAPNVLDLHFNRGLALARLSQFEPAIAAFDRALALSPGFANAHINRGHCLHLLRRHDESLICFETACRLAPDLARAHYNRGRVLYDLRRDGEAIAACQRAIALEPGDGAAHLCLGYCLLRLGDYAGGWQACEQSYALKSVPEPGFEGAMLESLDGLEDRTVLLYSSQGLGDAIQFSRFAVALADRAARVILWVQEPLVRLLAQLHPRILVVSGEEEPPPFDLQARLFRLPGLLGTTVAAIPAAARYLESDVELREQWSARLPAGAGPRVGLAWRGNPELASDPERSIALADLLPLLPDGVTWICLQQDIPEEDRELLRQDKRVHVLTERFEDLADTAALVDLLDLVITVDTSIAHLAAALGKPTWILLAFCSDWRWLLGRDESPWYPSVRLFRQQERGNWRNVIRRVREALLAGVASVPDR